MASCRLRWLLLLYCLPHTEHFPGGTVRLRGVDMGVYRRLIGPVSKAYGNSTVGRVRAGISALPPLTFRGSRGSWGLTEVKVGFLR